MSKSNTILRQLITRRMAIIFAWVFLFDAFSLLNFGFVRATENMKDIPDPDITRAVENALLVDEDLPSHLSTVTILT